MSAAMKSSTSVRAATLATASGSDEAVEPMIVRFLDAVWMERGLSPNTLAAYRADLTALSRWLRQRSTNLERTTRNDLRDRFLPKLDAVAQQISRSLI